MIWLALTAGALWMLCFWLLFYLDRWTWRSRRQRSTWAGSLRFVLNMSTLILAACLAWAGVQAGGMPDSVALLIVWLSIVAFVLLGGVMSHRARTGGRR